MRETVYILGHSDEEIRRLELQAEVLKPLTARLLRDAGLGAGMSVLDIGTGAGDVAMLAGAMVGSKNRVVGIDRNQGALDRAKARAQDTGLGWIGFEQADFGPGTALGRFDFVIGRYVLMHQSDPAAFLQRAAAHVTEGGVLAVVEMAQNQGDRFSVPPVETYDTAMNGILAAFLTAHADLDVGSQLAPLFAKAGLPQPALTADVPVGGTASALPEWIARTIHIVRREPAEGTTWAALAEAIRREATDSHSQLFGPRSVAAWVRIGRPATTSSGRGR